MNKNEIWEKFITDLKRNNNIVDVVSTYAVLKRNGGSYWANCPLPGHSERTPSFCVNEAGQFYHCFGCGRGGDVIKFVMEMESVDFVEAAKILAEKSKMEMPETTHKEKDDTDKLNRSRLLDVLRETALFYVHNLNNAPQHTAYIRKRGISNQALKDFGIGASLDYDALPKYLLDKGFTREEMLSAGVVQEGDNKRLSDAQGKRLIIPIIDNFNKVIAFGGRWLEKTDRAKYKNTSETKIFIKNKTLYNINNLKKLKSSAGSIDNVIVVEGYMDTISVYDAGIKNVVASMGTSLTVQQAKLLNRYTDNVTICYDGDFAGQKGAIRGLEILKAEGLNVKIASIPDNKDPDDVIKQYGADRFKEIINGALPLINFKLKLVRDKYGENASQPDKNRLIEKSLEIIGESTSASEREELLKELRDNTGITYESLKRDLEKVQVEGVQTESIVAEMPKEVSDKVKQSGRYILNSYLDKKIYAESLDLQDYIFRDSVQAKLADLIIYENFTKDKTGEYFEENELEEVQRIFESGRGIYDTYAERKYFSDCIKVFKIDQLEREIDDLNKSFSEERDIKSREILLKHINEKTLSLARLKNGG